MSALAEALVAAQAELPCTLGKDAANEGAGYRYLTLDKLIAETRPILQRHGLTISQWPCVIMRSAKSSEAEPGQAFHAPGLMTSLSHVGGETWKHTMPLYVPEKTMQGYGAAITYARRYAWQSVLGIAAEEDTDAADKEVPF